MATRTHSSVLDPAVLLPAIGQAFRKLDPRLMVRNPVMFVVEVVAALTTVLFIRDVVAGGVQQGFTLQIIAWLRTLAVDIADFLTPDHVVLDVKLRDKAHLIKESARLCGTLVPGVAPASAEAALMAREELGSTGLGAGFALPHARIDGLRDYGGLFLRLARPIEFSAIDGKPV